MSPRCVRVKLDSKGAPSTKQVVLCSAAAASAGVATEDLSAVSTHGTGTPLGDPIEVGALGQALKRTSGDASSVLLLSNKACFGHTEGTAGLSGDHATDT